MAHRWHFYKAGGVDQVSIGTGADFLALRTLDRKLWVALAMPTRDVDIDPATLDLLDTDKDGRIRIPDVLAAVDFIEASHADPDIILRGGDVLPLSAIKDPKIAGAARRILGDAVASNEIALSHVTAATEALASTKLNGDGVVTAESTDDPELRAAIEESIACVGSVTDRSGKPGIDQAKLDAFFAAIDETATWAAAGATDTAVMALGAATPAAADSLGAVRDKVHDFFVRCRMAAFEPRTAASLTGSEAALAELAGASLAPSAEPLARLPLARVGAKHSLALNGELNPAWSDRVSKFADTTVKPILGARGSISESEFATVVDKLKPFDAWRALRPANPVSSLAVDRVRALASGTVRGGLADLIAADLALADDYDQMHAVEKLLRLQRDFARLLRNFVNFSDFYSRKDGVFQTGTLYLDRRAVRLCVPVTDAAKHGALAGMSGAYLVYCELARAGQKRSICGVVTNGDGDNLMVGRNGVFFDREDRDWDATITRIVANPISVREAFWSPYKKLARLIDEQVAKRASASEAAAGAKLETTAAAVAHADKTVTAAPEAEKTKPVVEPRKIDVGTVAAIGVAIGGIGAMVVGVFSSFMGLGKWVPLGLLAVMLMISGPSMLLAWLKLRQRNLGPILDANGWALNSRARINVAFGAALTDLAVLPENAKRSLDDPYADKSSPWKLYITLVVLLILAGTWYVGRLDRYLPNPAKSTTVLGKYAPATSPEPPAEAPAK